MAYIGNRPVSGDNNSFRVLDDIKTHTFSFDGSSSSVVSTSDNTITHIGHRLVQGQRVTYTDGTGSAIGGLTDGTVYFVIMNDANSFKLASSASNAAAGTGINLTSVGSGTDHTITVAFDGVNTKFKATFNNGTEADVTRVAQIQISLNNVIQQPQNTPTPTSGFGFESDSVIVFASAPASTVTFWGVLFANNFPTFEISDNDVDNFTGDGSKTDFTLSKSPASNENIIVTIDGVVQYPSDSSTTRAYNTVANTLQFSSAPANGADIQARHIGFAGPDESGGVTAFYGRTGSVFLNNSDNIVVNNAEVAGNLTVQGTMTTLDTKVTEVDQLEVAANNTTVGVAITQSGSGDILNLYDGSTEVFTVEDGGNVGIGTNNPGTLLHLYSSSPILKIEDVTANQSQFTRLLQMGAGFRVQLRSGSNDGTLTVQGYGNATPTDFIRVENNGNVGINSSSPSEKLDVIGNIKSTGTITASSFVGALPIANDVNNRLITASGSGGLNAEGGLLYDGTYFTHTGSGYKQITASTTTNNSVQLKLQNSVKNFNITNVAGGVFQLAEGPTSRFKLQDGVSFLDSTVGVGTNTLTNLGNSQVNIEGTAALTNHNQTLIIRDSVADDATGRGGNIGFGAYVDGTMRTLAAIGAFKKNDGTGFDGHLALYTRRNGVGPVDEVMRLESGGDVGIGTTNPVGKLHLFAETGDCVLTLESDRGNDASNENDNPYIVFKQDGHVSNSAIGVNPNGINGESNSLVLVNGVASGGLIFKTGSDGSINSGTSEKMRITPDGEIRIADGGKITINTDVSGNYAIQEAFRVDDGNSTGDRALQIFEYHNNGVRWHSFNQNLDVTTTGSSYTYTQGNFGGSNMIEMLNGNLQIYSDSSIVSGGTSAITPTERIRLRSDGKVLVGGVLGADPYDDRKLTVNSTSNTYISIQSGDSSFSGIVFGHASGQSTDNFLTYVRHNNANNSFNIHTNSQPTPKITITSAGDVGIGSESPQAKLDVNGSLNVTGISTFATDINVTNKVTCKNLVVSHDGNATLSLIDTGHGFSASTIGLSNGGRDLAIASPRDIRLKPSGGLNGIVIENNGPVELYHANNKKAATSASGLDVTGNVVSDGLVVDGHTELDDLNVSGVTTTSRIDINSTTPIIDFLESDGNPDYRVYAEGGELVIREQNPNVSNRLVINSTGVSIPNDLNVSGNVGVGSTPDERLHVVVTSATATAAKFERSHNNNVSIEYKNVTSRMYAGLAGDALGWAVDDDANLGVDPMFMVRRTTGFVGVGVVEPLRKLDVVGTGSGGISILARPTAENIHSSGNASSVNNSIIIRMPYGENPGTTSNAGARFGIQFTGANNTTDISSLNWGDDPHKSASIYGVSEDSLGYSRKVGMAFYTSEFDATQEERLRITNDGKVGIGTNSPDEALHIQSGSPVIKFSDGQLNSFIKGDASDLKFISGGTSKDFMFQSSVLSTSEVVRITGDGKVGIGTNNPERILDVIGDAAIEGDLFLSDVSGQIVKFNGAGGNLDVFSDGTIDFIESDHNKTMVTFDINTIHDDARIYMEGDSNTYFNHPADNELGFTIGGTDTMRLQPSQVGIGTVNPTSLFHIMGGDCRLRWSKSNAGANLKHWDLSAQGEIFRIQAKNDADAGGGNLFDFHRTTNQINEFRGVQSGNTWFVVDNDNREVGIRTDNPDSPLHVETPVNHSTVATFGATGDTAETYQAILIKNDVSGYPALVNASSPDVLDIRSAGSIQATIDSNNNDTNKFFRVTANGNGTSGTELFRVQENGNVGINTNSPSATLEVKDIGSTGPCILIRGATSTEGDLTVPDGESFNFGHWNYSSSAFTERVRVSPDGLTTLKNFNGTGLKLEGSGSDYQGMQLQVTDASASQTRNIFIDTVNETGAAVANQVGQIQSDGGSHWSWSTQAAGDRTDRRVERVRIKADGKIGISSISSTGTAVVEYESGSSLPSNAVGGITVKVGDEQISNEIKLPRNGHIMVVTGFSDSGGVNYPQPQASGMLYVDVGISTNIRSMYTQSGVGSDATSNVGTDLVGRNSHTNTVSDCADGRITIMPGTSTGTIRICNREASSAYVFYLTFL